MAHPPIRFGTLTLPRRSRASCEAATPWRFALPYGPPDVMLRAMFGEVASVITTGQKVLPTRPLALGYTFRYPQLADALREIFTRKPEKPEAPPQAACRCDRITDRPANG